MSYLALNHSPESYPVEKLSSGWLNARVTFQRRDLSRTARIEIISFKTNERYLQEPMQLIAFKSFGLAAFILHAYFFCYGVFHLLRLPIITLRTLSPTVFVHEIWTLSLIHI